MRVTDNNQKIREVISNHIRTVLSTPNTVNALDNIPTLKIAHISHLDLDGYGSTALSIMLSHFILNGISLSYFNINPNRVNETLKNLIDDPDQFDIIFVTDLSINTDLVNMINDSDISYKILVFDHHVTKIEDLPDNILVTKTSPFSTLENKPTCATELYYNFLEEVGLMELLYQRVQSTETTKLKVAAFVELVRVYDTYEFWNNRNSVLVKYKEAPDLNILFHLIDPAEFLLYVCKYVVVPEMYPIVSDTLDYPWISKIIEIEKNRIDKYVAAAIRRSSKTDFDYSIFKNGNITHLKYLFAVVFAERNAPLIASNILEADDSIEICAVVSNNQVGLYTNKKHIDVSVIAKLLNGGGHEEAAGFIIPYPNAATYNINHFNSIIKCAGSIVDSEV